MKNLTIQAPCSTALRYSKGQEASCEHYAIGDFILTHGKELSSQLIRFGQSLRFRGTDAKYAHWNHAAIIMNEKGDLIEALTTGIALSNLSKYKDEEYIVVHIVADSEDRIEAINFALACLRLEYGWSIIISIALSFLTGLKFSFGFDGQFICSGLVARALERTSAIFDKEPSHITPADLAKYYKVE